MIGQLEYNSKGEMNAKFNKYDILLVAIFTSLAAGSLGGFFQPIRILFFMLIPFIVYDKIKPIDATQAQKTSPSFRYERILLIFWWAYAFISLAFAINYETSAKELTHLTIYFVGFFEIMWLASNANNPQRATLFGWLLFFLATLPIATYELFTDHHLAMSVQEEGTTMKFGNIQEARRFASVTFGNLNSYNTVLCYIFAILLIRAHTTLSKLSSRINLASVIIASILIVINSSRGAIICFIVILIIQMFLSLKYKHSHSLVMIVCFLVVTYFIITHFSNIFYIALLRFEDQGLADAGRYDIIASSCNEIINSMGFGIGVGNFSSTMHNKYYLDVNAPHNLWLEIGVQFGLLILLGFIGMLIRIWKKARIGNDFNKIAALLGIFALIFSSIIDSAYIKNASLWTYIASLYILCNPFYNKANEKS